MLLRQDGGASCDAAHQWQRKLRQIWVGKGHLADTKSGQAGAIRQSLKQPNAARRAGGDLDRAFSGKRL